MAERKDPRMLVDTLRAETTTKHRQWQLYREARGITFDQAGRLLARPYAYFDPLEQLSDEEWQHAGSA
ncbi:MAG: hypothetical protein R3C05_19375 [Pirellulaceae bacterium]